MADRNTSIRASQLRNGTVTDKDIQDDSLTGIKFVDVTISGGKIAAGAISESKLDIVNNPVDGYYLKYTTASGMEWFAGGGVSDHGSLTGLADDDHTQYLLANGTRELSGTWNYGPQTISGTGDIYTSGDVGIGLTNPTSKLHIYNVNTSVVVDTQYAQYIDYIVSPSANHQSNTKRRGIGSYVSIPNTSTNDVHEVMGIIGMSENYGSGDIYAMYAVNGWTYNYSDVSIDHLSGGWIGAESDAGEVGEFKVLELVGYGYCNTITSMYGLKVGGLVSSTTSGVTNRYGVYIANLTGTATNDYGVYQAGASQKNYFAGDVECGALTVNGNVLPDASGTQDIGSASLPWKDLYLTGNSLYMGGTKVLSMSDGSLKVASGDLEADEIRAIDSSGLSLKDDAGNLAIFIEDGGKVGIGGITNPSSSLDVKTTFGVWNAAETRGATRGQQAEYADWWYYNGSGWTTPLAMSDLKANMSVGFMDGWVGIANTKTNSLEATGIGVDVSGPTEKLEVGTDTNVSAIIGRAHIGYDGSSSDVATFAHIDYTNSSSFALQHTNLGSTTLNAADTKSIFFKVNAFTKAELTATSLDMFAGIYITTGEIRASNAGGLYLRDDSGTGGIFIEDGGNVGIGTTTPSGKLHVSGSHIFTNMGYGFMSCDTEGNLAGMYIHTDDSLRLITNATPRLTISEAGNIDITGNLTFEHGTSVNEFSIDTTLSGNSDTAVPTEKAVKTYIDSATGISSGCHVYASSVQSIPNTTFTKITLNTEEYDNQNEFASNRFTAKIAGVYMCSGAVGLDSLADGKLILSCLYKNGVAKHYGNFAATGASTDTVSVVSVPIKLAVGEYVELYGYHDHGSARDTESGSSYTYLTVQKMTAASEHGSAHENSSYVKVSDVKSAGTAGGTFTQDAWQTRTLNTKDNDPDAICSLSSNQITLDAGTYECRVFATAFFVDRNVARLRNVTGSTTVLAGMPAIAGVAGVDQTQAIIVGRFTIAASQALEVQHRCYTTNTDDGFGYAANYGENEVYTIAEFWKISEDGSGAGSGFSSRMSASLSANQTGVVTATWTKVELNTEQFDGLGEFNTSTHLFTPNTNGYYQINACIGHEGMGDADTVQTAIYVNSARVAHASIDTGGTSSPGIPISKLVYLTTSDTVSLWGRHTLGVNGAFDAGISETYLTIHRVS